jgi:hypothetical protein
MLRFLILTKQNQKVSKNKKFENNPNDYFEVSRKAHKN